jgi:molybdopterin molybdotransferase
MSDYGFSPDPKPEFPVAPPHEEAAERGERGARPDSPPARPAAASGAHHAHAHADDDELRDVDEVRAWILESIPSLTPIELPLPEAHACVMAGDVTAQMDMPPFSSSAMDGFAVRAVDVAEATQDSPIKLRIVGRAAAGHPAEGTVGMDESLRIATGAPVPAGSDCVIPVEMTYAEGEHVYIQRALPEGANVRPAGQDARGGEVLVPKGRKIGAAELGLLAASGRASVFVYPRPRVAVLSTGDELVEPGRPAPFGMIRDSNSFTLFGGLREAGAAPYLGGIVRDDPDALRESVLGLAIRSDVFVSSGGVSVGERDVVKKAFFRRGDVEFYKVAMQPGMPQGFGMIEGKPYFGLPGNPVSVFVSFEVFIRPALLKMMGRRDIFRPEVTAVLESDVSGPKQKMVFARVRVSRDQGRWHAASTGPGASNLLTTVTKANGLAIIPPGVETAEAGSEVRVMLFRALEDDA